MTTPRTPRVIKALNDVINIKGEIMDIVRKKYPYMTLQEALPHFTWYRYSYEFNVECLEIARKQAIILQQIIDGVPFFYEKQYQTNNYFPIHKFEWDDGGYICYRQIFHFENHQKVLEWKMVGKASMKVISNRLNSFSYLASLTPMTNNYQYNLE